MGELEPHEHYTLVDLAKESFNKKILPIAEILNEATPVIRTAHIVEANSLTSHVFDRRATLPAGTFTAFNQGIPYEASQVDQLEEPMATCESLAAIDERILRKSPSPYKTRDNRERAFIMGMGITFEEYFFYGNAALNPKAFTGLAPRYDSATDAQVIDEGGSGSGCSSIFLVEWGEDGVYLIYPTGSKTVGIRTDNLGRQLISDGEATPHDFPAYVNHHIWEAGLVVADPDAVQRIASIAVAGTAGVTFNYQNMITAINKLPGRGRPVAYCARAILTQMDIDVAAKTNLYLTIDMAYGKKTTHFREVPVFRADQISENETAL